MLGAGKGKPCMAVNIKQRGRSKRRFRLAMPAGTAGCASVRLKNSKISKEPDFTRFTDPFRRKSGKRPAGRGAAPATVCERWKRDFQMLHLPFGEFLAGKMGRRKRSKDSCVPIQRIKVTCVRYRFLSRRKSVSSLAALARRSA